jgi:signal transduction histidine kinase
LLYQAVSELLLNVVKHARARHVQVSVWREGDTLRLGVYDDGVGFDSSTIRERWGRREGGFGLFSIRERLRSYGGGLEVESRPGFGTQVVMTVPLKADQGE